MHSAPNKRIKQEAEKKHRTWSPNGLVHGLKGMAKITVQEEPELE